MATATDLSYFSEEKLSWSDIVYFYGLLPTDHLKENFKGSIRTKIIWANVLQGYEGPSKLCNGGSGASKALKPLYGIQEVRLCWGITKNINFLPIAGSVAFGITRLVQKIQGGLEWTSLYFDFKTEECLGHDKNDVADKLNTKGEQLFEEGRYSEAAEYHYNAYRFCSKGYEHQQKFEDNRNKARTEVDALNLHNQGEDLLREGNYSEAYSKFQKACDKSQNKKEKEKYAIKLKQIEDDAEKLDREGSQLFMEGKYSEAAEYHYNAYRFCSDGYKHQQKFEDNRNKAKTEVDALNLHTQGEDLLLKGNYSEAYSKFQKACKKSQITKEIEKYAICRNKAKVELDAIELKQLGDVEFNAGRFDTAKVKYQEAYNKTTKEKEKYMEDIKKISTIRDELRILKTLWDEGWTLENDTENDQSGEAKKSFQLVLVKSIANLEIFPDNLRLKEYETLASLKEDGNELFNQGYEFQQVGVELLQEAHAFEEQQKIKSAHQKFQEAKDKFSIAKEKFIRGSRNDDRFLICIELVQEKLNQVMHSMEIIKSHALNQRLNDLLVGNDDQDTNGNQSSTREQHNYHEQN